MKTTSSASRRRFSVAIVLPPWPALPLGVPEREARNTWAFDYVAAIRKANPFLIIPDSLALRLARDTFTAAANEDRFKT